MFAKVRLLWAIGGVLSFALLQKNSSPAQEVDSVRPPADIEVQTRGPVHEAFAQPFDLKSEPGPAVPKKPPATIPELPPEERPPGDNVQWVGGYWSWDADRNDFIWVSGTYRNAPTGRQFIPGHWVNTPDGWRWVSGFWTPDSQRDIPYTDQPPAPLDSQPSLPPPDDNSTYIPGYWFNRDSTFIWRPGFYTPFRAGRIWNRPRYNWTPAGYIFVDGYWDYPLEDRGLLFAPVCFNRPLWQTPGWCYRPNYVVGFNGLLDSLFCRNQNFYFGNYYGPGYARQGFQPWFARGNDPLFNYYGWNNRGNPNWAAGQQRLFNERTAGRSAAPPQTFAQQNATNRMVTPLSQVANNRLTRVTPAQLTAQNANIQRSNQLAQLRNQQENGRFKGNSGTSLKVPPQARTTGNLSSTGGPQANSSFGNNGKNQPRVIANSPGVPRVLNNSVNIPQRFTIPTAPKVINHATPPSRSSMLQSRSFSPAPNYLAPASPSTIPQTRSFSPAPNYLAPASRPTIPQTRSFSPAPHYAAPSTARAGRTVNHTPARSGGGGGRRGGRR